MHIVYISIAILTTAQLATFLSVPHLSATHIENNIPIWSQMQSQMNCNYSSMEQTLIYDRLFLLVN